MRKIFLDCGANKGQSVRMFRDHYPSADEFEIYSFEASSNFIEFFDGLNVNFENKAVWTHDGEIKFYDLAHDKISESSSVIKEKVRNRNYTRKIIPCIDLSLWIKNNFTKDDFIVLKLDIEGAEYAVLEKMFDDDTIEYVDHLYMDWHWSKTRNEITRERHIELLENLFEIGLFPYKWGTEKAFISPGVAMGTATPRGVANHPLYNPAIGMENFKIDIDMTKYKEKERRSLV